MTFKFQNKPGRLSSSWYKKHVLIFNSHTTSLNEYLLYKKSSYTLPFHSERTVDREIRTGRGYRGNSIILLHTRGGVTPTQLMKGQFSSASLAINYIIECIMGR